MTCSNLPRKGRSKGRYGRQSGAAAASACSDLTPQVATCSNLENGHIPEAIQSCSNRSNLSQSKGLEEGGKNVNGAYGVNNRPEVATVATEVFVHLTVQGQVAFARKDQRTKLVACSDGSGKPNSHGTRVGEDHPRATLTNAQVEEIRDRFEAYELGHPKHEGSWVLAKAYGVSRRTVRDILSYRNRSAFPARWKRVTSD